MREGLQGAVIRPPRERGRTERVTPVMGVVRQGEAVVHGTLHRRYSPASRARPHRATGMDKVHRREPARAACLLLQLLMSSRLIGQFLRQPKGRAETQIERFRRFHLAHRSGSFSENQRRRHDVGGDIVPDAAVLFGTDSAPMRPMPTRVDVANATASVMHCHLKCVALRCVRVRVDRVERSMA
jgi:hypothetical protein